MPVQPRWILPAQDEGPLALARDLGVEDVVGRLIWRLGLRNPEAAAAFLDPRLRSLGDPFLLPDMGLAADRLFAAIDGRERVVLYGDYDVDGVTSLTLLREVLGAYGLDAPCFLPLRREEGYGLTRDGMERCLAEHRPQLLIAVDCGTASATQVAELGARGVDTIILDHHECPAQLPRCAALVNPKRGGDFQYLCSAGLAFKFAHALLKRRPLPGFDLKETLDLVAVGTVADLVPLIGENRILVRAGLARLRATRRPGLQALIDVSQIRGEVRPGDVGYRIGPRLNAAGRLGTAQEALELLTTADPARARALALSLDTQNRERQNVERQTLRDAERQLASDFDAGRDAAIVVGARGWHPGVIGIVASRLMRAHHRPTFVVGFDETGMGKGSGRSIQGLSLVEALRRCDALLEQFGGHEMAAGLTVREERFPDFREKFRAVARELLDDEQLRPSIQLDAEVSLEEVQRDLLAAHDRLQPFGNGNPQPLFFARGVTPAAEPRIVGERHLLFALQQGRTRAKAIFFGGAAETLPRPPWDLAFQIEPDEYQGVTSVSVQIRALRTAGEAG